MQGLFISSVTIYSGASLERVPLLVKELDKRDELRFYRLVAKAVLGF
ncbi:MAG: hypothetical protein LM585_00855 [Fervidicoccaceae archaeon]|nr:hypothetical protein [Fervidicoccaceae archaeon]